MAKTFKTWPQTLTKRGSFPTQAARCSETLPWLPTWLRRSQSSRPTFTRTRALRRSSRARPPDSKAERTQGARTLRAALSGTPKWCKSQTSQGSRAPQTSKIWTHYTTISRALKKLEKGAFRMWKSQSNTEIKTIWLLVNRARMKHHKWSNRSMSQKTSISRIEMALWIGSRPKRLSLTLVRGANLKTVFKVWGFNGI